MVRKLLLGLVVSLAIAVGLIVTASRAYAIDSCNFSGYYNGNAYGFYVTAQWHVNASERPVDIEVDWGDGNSTFDTRWEFNGVVRYDHTYPGSGSYGGNIYLTDANGSQCNAGFGLGF
jgi:hypothetical protein